VKKIIPLDAVLVPDSATKVFQGVIYDVYQWPQTLFDGSEATFEMLKRPDTVSAICVVDDKLLVLKEEQPHSGERLSFPGGRVDSTDKSPLAAIKRELHEETGYSFKKWRLVNVKQMHTKIEWFIHLFLAWDVDSKSNPHIDGGEKIEVTFMSFDEVKKLSQESNRYIDESQDVFKLLTKLDDLLTFAPFQGQEVDR